MSKGSPLSGGYSYLMIAAEEGDLGKVRAILPSQQLNAKNQVSPTQAGYTALALAVKNRQLHVAEELIAKGGDVNSTNNVRTSQAGQSVLFLACWNDCMDAVQMLLTSGADVNTADQVMPR
jgi:ankyrin repeat protein